MNGVLTALASVAAEAAPADSFIPTLDAIMAAVATGALGFLFGTMRDWSKTKAERIARHREEVLEASTVLLDTASAIIMTNVGTAAQKWEMEDLEDYIVPDPDREARLPQGRQNASESVSSWRREGRPAYLKLKVLAPSLTPQVDAIWEGTETSTPNPAS